MLTLPALKSELLNDPTARGYAPYIADGNHTQLAALLNEVQPGISVTRTSVTSTEILHAIQPAAYAALTAVQRQWIDLALAAPGVDPGNPNIVAGFGQFPAGPTRTALIALSQRTGSRAEQLFGASTTVTSANIADALALE